jgi:hypothetical protein
MRLLGGEYSEKIENLWNELKPSPIICEFPQPKVGESQTLKFLGKHHYSRAAGDLVFIVPDEADEYVLAHELMHVVLRRKEYPHFTFRALGLDFRMVLGIVQQLEAAALHPILNGRLKKLGIEISKEYAVSFVQQVENNVKNDRVFAERLPEYLPWWCLLFTEIKMWNLYPLHELRTKLDFPEAWNLAELILQQAGGIENGSPEQCRDFAVASIKICDEYLELNRGQEKNLFFNRIMFPPPPFLAGHESPAKNYFDVQMRNLTTGGQELEILCKSDGTLCWSDGPLYPPMAEKRFVLVRTALESVSSESFADFCERLLSTVIP